MFCSIDTIAVQCPKLIAFHGYALKPAVLDLKLWPEYSVIKKTYHTLCARPRVVFSVGHIIDINEDDLISPIYLTIYFNFNSCVSIRFPDVPLKTPT